MKQPKIVIVSGVSGAGNSTAISAFQDNGFFCVENLPSAMMPAFVSWIKGRLESSREAQENDNVHCENTAQYALLLNCRDANFSFFLDRGMKELKNLGLEVSLLFFDCLDEIIARRYRETRRPHPLLINSAEYKTLADALAKERELLADFREAAEKVVDTSAFSPHDLRRFVEAYCLHTTNLEISLLSFGYKYGAPQDADLLVDVRFLNNPYFVDSLRGLTGEDPRIVDFVLGSADADELLKRYLYLLEFLVPKYQREGKRYLTIAVGCTGGQHRSVVIAAQVAAELKKRDFNPKLRHRDIDKRSS